jgi:nucleoside-diphosphate-sugar epimerase
MIQLSGKKYLVTGGAGFIGSHICEEVLNQGKQVVCVDNLVAGKHQNIQFFANPNFTFIKKDIVDLSVEEFKGVDVVFNNAASKCTVCRDDPKKDLLVNAWGAWNVFHCARESNVKKVVHASTGSVLNGKPKSFYGVSKLAGEAYLRAFKDYWGDFNYTVLRYYHVFGSRQESSDKGGVIPIFIRRLLQDQPLVIFGDGKQVRHFTSVKDVVNANFLVAENAGANCEDYEVLSNVTITILDLAHLLQKLLDVKTEIQFQPRRLGDIEKFNVNNEKLMALGFQFNPNFEEELLETAKWYKKILPH